MWGRGETSLPVGTARKMTNKSNDEAKSSNHPWDTVKQCAWWQRIKKWRCISFINSFRFFWFPGGRSDGTDSRSWREEGNFSFLQRLVFLITLHLFPQLACEIPRLDISWSANWKNEQNENLTLVFTKM